ncbi:MAG: PilZ domain-containing protein [Gammaproteobacteria bacterium]|jgi:hypothetical protein
MEKRESTRQPGHIKVLIYRNKLPVATCYTENLGPGGMFVTSSPVTYHRNTRLEVEFEGFFQGSNRRYRIPAQVVFSGRTGMGLRFVSSDSYENEISRMMLGYVYSETVKRSAYASNIKSEAAA